MYKMGMDAISGDNREMRVKIKKNIGFALLKKKQFGKAIELYEDIMNDLPDH